MAMSKDLTEAQLAVIAKAEKLYALAGNNPNEHEAASALAAAQRLLEAYNLDALTFQRNSGNKAHGRDNKYLNGGLYVWQRTLWNSIAQLHFCKYWYVKGNVAGSTYQHRILGSKTNVLASRLMSEYLQGVVERLAREWATERGLNIFAKPAISYREGMAGKLVARLEQLRRDRLAEDERKQREEATRSRHPGAAPGTGLILQSVIQSEEDANNDFIHGEGYSARVRAARAAAEADYQARVEARRRWEQENPELFAKQQEEARIAQAEYARKEAARNKRRAKQPVPHVRSKQYKGDLHAYWAGHSKGDDIGLDQQVAHTNRNKLS